MTQGSLFVCPRCKGALAFASDVYRCPSCVSEFPVVCGIPDFRLEPDPYIGIEDDRRKGERLSREGTRRSFADLVRHYYETTPEDPPDLAERWTAHALREVAIADALLRDAGLVPAPAGQSGALLDVGCSTGGLLVAAAGSYARCVGVDVAFRWLVVAQVRLREAGVTATLACANAEYLPFPEGRFQAIAATDVLEHVRDPRAMLRETHRVSASGALTLCTANNRYWPGVEPNVRLRGIGYLPRRWQARWVAARRGDLHPYRLALSSANELRRAFRAAHYRNVVAEPALLHAPQSSSRLVGTAVGFYNRWRKLPLLRPMLTLAGPRLRILGTR